MANIHELREDYRHYRMQNPQYRLLFALGDLVSVLVKLAVLAFLVYALWYLMGRSEMPASAKIVAEVPTAARNGVIVNQTSFAQTTSDPAELTAERIQLLKRIAGEPLVAESTEAPVMVTAQSSQAASPYADADEEMSSRLVGLATRDFGAEYITPSVDQSSRVGEEGFWLRNQSASNYTVQLAMTVNRPFLFSLADELPEGMEASVHLERLNSKGDEQYSLSAGSYATKEQAESALQSLPESVRRFGAHTRSFGEIHKRLDEFEFNGSQ